MFEAYSIGEIPRDRCWRARSNGQTWEPFLPVVLTHAGFVSARLHALVDSGSEVTLFQGYIGEQIGLKVRSGPSYKIRTASGDGGALAYFHEVQLKLPIGSIRIMAGFCYELGVSALLGRHGFFEHFRVTFDPSRRGMLIDRVEVE